VWRSRSSSTPWYCTTCRGSCSPGSRYRIRPSLIHLTLYSAWCSGRGSGPRPTACCGPGARCWTCRRVDAGRARSRRRGVRGGGQRRWRGRRAAGRQWDGAGRAAVADNPVSLSQQSRPTFVVQESLTNVLKHAGPASVTVSLGYRPDRLVVRVTDAGRGTPGPNPAGSGHGLLGMTERARLYGGSLDAGPCPEGGFQVILTLPIPPPTGRQLICAFHYGTALVVRRPGGRALVVGENQTAAR
jgi:hypothetical protein